MSFVNNKKRGLITQSLHEKTMKNMIWSLDQSEAASHTMTHTSWAFLHFPFQWKNSVIGGEESSKRLRDESFYHVE